MGKSSGLLDEIEKQARNGRRTGPRCAMAEVFAALDPDEAAELQAALDGHFAGSSIGRALRGRGFIVSDYTVNRHRRGDCTCGAA